MDQLAGPAGRAARRSRAPRPARRDRPRVTASRAAPAPTTPPPIDQHVELVAGHRVQRRARAACGDSATGLMRCPPFGGRTSRVSRRPPSPACARRPSSTRRSPRRAAPRSTCGCQRLASFQFSRSSSVFFQKPTASPAAYAAPSAVVSATTGRLTGTPSMSAWICMHRSLAVTPPSTLSTSSVHAGVLLHRLDDVAALVADRLQRGPGQVRVGVEAGQPDDRAAGVGAPVRREQPGERRHEVDAAVVLDLRGPASRSRAAPLMMPSWSRSHCTAEPVTAIEPSSAYTGRLVAELVADRGQQAVPPSGPARCRC